MIRAGEWFSTIKRGQYGNFFKAPDLNGSRIPVHGYDLDFREDGVRGRLMGRFCPSYAEAYPELLGLFRGGSFNVDLFVLMFVMNELPGGGVKCESNPDVLRFTLISGECLIKNFEYSIRDEGFAEYSCDVEESKWICEVPPTFTL